MISIAMYRCAIGNFNASYKIYMKKRNGSMNKFNFQSLYTMLSFILLMGKYFYGTYEKTLQNVNNKVCHVINGNVSANGTYNLLSWNKGNSNFSTRRDDILITLDRLKPDIFSIHEANFSIKNDRKIIGYKIESNNLIHGNDICRTVTLIKDGISYKRRYDLEDKYISSIWLQIFISKRVSILVCSYYRQWGLPATLNVNGSNSTKSQCEISLLVLVSRLGWVRCIVF